MNTPITCPRCGAELAFDPSMADEPCPVCGHFLTLHQRHRLILTAEEQAAVQAIDLAYDKHKDRSLFQ